MIGDCGTLSDGDSGGPLDEVEACRACLAGDRKDAAKGFLLALGGPLGDGGPALLGLALVVVDGFRVFDRVVFAKWDGCC